MAATQTYTVVTSWTTSLGDHWVVVRGIGRMFQTDALIPVNRSVTLNGDRAVLA